MYNFHQHKAFITDHILKDGGADNVFTLSVHRRVPYKGAPYTTQYPLGNCFKDGNATVGMPLAVI